MRCFLHYASEHVGSAREIYAYLQKLGIETWFDKEDLVGGLQWQRELDNIIDEIDLVFAVTSRETIQKTGTLQREIRRLLDRAANFPLGHVFFVNLRAEETTLPPEISKYQWIDLFENDWRTAILKTLEKKFLQSGKDIPSSFRSATSKLNRETRSHLAIISEKTDFAELNASFVQYDKSGDYWDFINAKIRATVYRDYFDSRRQLKAYYENSHKDRILQWSTSVDEYFNKEEITSLRMSWYFDGGGAHPNHGTKSLNFFGEDVGCPSIKDLFGYRTECISFISKYCKDNIELTIRSLGSNYEEGLVFFEPSGDDQWLQYENFVFNERGITFLFSPYDILAYAYGDFEVPMPWNYFHEHLDADFKETKFASFVANNIR